VALSWTHNAPSPLTTLTVNRLSGGPVKLGVAVAFGVAANLAGLRDVNFGSGSLDTHTCEAFMLESINSNFGSLVYSRLPDPQNDERGPRLIPVKVTKITSGRIVTADELPLTAGGTASANGVAFIFDTGASTRFAGREIFIQLRCDLIRDVASNLPVDGDFLSGVLMTGNGIPGGTFWSWFSVPAAVSGPTGPS
jgi:hypothetical protein